MTIKMLNITGACEEYFIAPEKLIQGNPLQKIWIEYTDPSEQFFVGIWQSEQGKWHIHYTEEEYCHILEGESEIFDLSNNQKMIVKPGDRFVIPAGFTGTWTVIKATKKHFVIYEKK